MANVPVNAPTPSACSPFPDSLCRSAVAETRPSTCSSIHIPSNPDPAVCRVRIIPAEHEPGAAVITRTSSSALAVTQHQCSRATRSTGPPDQLASAQAAAAARCRGTS